MADIPPVSLVIKTQVDGESKVARLSHTVQGLSGVARASAGGATSLAAALTNVGHEADAASGKLGAISNYLKGFGFANTGVTAIAQYVRGFVSLADEYGQMASRIRMVTTDTEEFEHVQGRLLATASATYRPLAEAQEVYIRTADALKSLGYNADQALDVTDSLSYLFVTNATSGDRAAGAIAAFSKALNTGKIDALGWQTIMAAVPSIVKNLADTTGKSEEEIRRLGTTGKLALTDFTEALRKTADAGQAAAAAMPTTLADGFTALTNGIQAYVGKLNESFGATNAVGGALGELGRNVDVLGNALMWAGGAAALRYVAGMSVAKAASLAASVAAQKSAAALAQSELTVAASISARSAAEQKLAIAELDSARAKVAATEAGIARANSIGTEVLRTLAVKRATEQHTAALAALAAAETRATAAGNNRTAALAGEATATLAARNAVTSAGTALGVFGTAARGALGFLGGPLGIALLVASVAAFISFEEKVNESAKALADLGDTTATVLDKFSKMGDAEKASALTGLKEQAEAAKDAVTKMKIEIRDKAAGLLGEGVGVKGMWDSWVNEATGATREALKIIQREINSAAPDFKKMANALQVEGVDKKVQKEFLDLIAEMEKGSAEANTLGVRFYDLNGEMTKTAYTAKNANLELKKIQTPKELREQIKQWGDLAKAIEKARKEKEKEAEAATKKAADLTQSGTDLQEAAREKAAAMRAEGLSEEERQAKATREAHYALGKARMAALEATVAQEQGNMEAFDKALQQAEQQLARAMRFAEQSGNDRLVETIGDEQKNNKDRQAERETDRAKTAEQEVEALDQRLQEVIGKIKELKETAVDINLEGSEQVLDEIDAIIKELNALPDEKTITITTNYVSNGTPPPVGNDAAPGFAAGGILPGFSPSDKADNLLFRGTAGEYVVQRMITRQPGALAFLERFNRMGMRALAGLDMRKLAPRVSLPEQAIAALPRFADGGILPSPAAPSAGSAGLAPTILQFPGIGDFPAQMAVDVQAELTKVLRREALKRGRRQ